MREEHLYRDSQASVDRVVLLSYGPPSTPALTEGRGGGYHLGSGEIGAFEDEIGVDQLYPPLGGEESLLDDILRVLKPGPKGCDIIIEQTFGAPKVTKAGLMDTAAKANMIAGAGTTAAAVVACASTPRRQDNGDTNVANLVAQATEKVGRWV
ncbi:hypothetical protein DFP72DRAFT_1153480 [Ephemerocybe angulata]|uniref:Uncharacterized protein n=1 Tax=Ephemerocybe angulata TaxID=980116 RepID=A0A8H6LYJ1_9AGAR|nr:hypothetical protein DFP72DRAFT_1153480 [Tulosesus angulatus]